MLELFKTDVLAMRKKKDPLASVMVFHLDEIQKIGKNDKSRVTSTDEAVQYIKKAVSKLNQEKFSNPQEIAILSKYLPVMATEQQLLSVITPILQAGGNTGQVMKAVKLEFGTSADMALVRTLC
jgi:uncharacterized protein YqeY